MKREDYAHAIKMAERWERKRKTAVTKLKKYLAKARRYELEAKKMTNYQVFMPHNGTHHRNIYVIEIDEGEMCKRICEQKKREVVWYKDKLVARYWLIATKVNYTGKAKNSAGHKAEREAYELIRKLKDGEKIEPTYIKRRSEHDGPGPTENL